MALLDYVDPEDADAAVRDLFAAEAEQYGRPSLFGRCLANAPDAYAARAAYVERLRETGQIDGRLSELAYVAVSVANDCEYAEAVATDPRRIGDDDLDGLRAVGFDDAGVAELTLLCASACAANAFADALNVLPQDRPDGR